MSDGPSWHKLALLGSPPLPLRNAFARAVGDLRRVGCLDLSGDRLEFGIRRSVNDQHLLIVETPSPPYFDETLSLLFSKADSCIVLRDPGLDEFHVRLERWAAGVPLVFVDCLHENEGDAPLRCLKFEAQVRAALKRLLPTDSAALAVQPAVFPYLPDRFPRCYEGKILGWGIGGEVLRGDIPRPATTWPDGLFS